MQRLACIAPICPKKFLNNGVRAKPFRIVNVTIFVTNGGKQHENGPKNIPMR
jgi:hypothetical protein